MCDNRNDDVVLIVYKACVLEIRLLRAAISLFHFLTHQFRKEMLVSFAQSFLPNTTF